MEGLRAKATGGKMRLWLVITAAVIVLDQLSKYLAASSLQLHEPFPVLPFLNLTLAYNTGAAFSFLADGAGWQRWFFVVLALLVSAIILRWLRALGPGDHWSGTALSLILGGALGNLLDRLMAGYVVDFIDAYYRAGACLPLFTPVPVGGDGLECHWPAFNVADSAIFVGAAMMVIETLKRPKAES